MFYVIIVLSSFFAHYFALGLSTFERDNNPPDKQERIARARNIEILELKEAILNFQLIDIILETCDVQLIVTKGLLYYYLPTHIYNSYYLWFFVFFTNPIAGIKTAERFRMNGCIRNHNNPNNHDHICHLLRRVS